jgi:hypothetical protein
MPNELARQPHCAIAALAAGPILSAVIADAGEKASEHFIEFQATTIRNAHTQQAYARAICNFFARSVRHRLAPRDIELVHVAAYF